MYFLGRTFTIKSLVYEVVNILTLSFKRSENLVLNNYENATSTMSATKGEYKSENSCEVWTIHHQRNSADSRILANNRKQLMNRKLIYRNLLCNIRMFRMLRWMDSGKRWTGLSKKHSSNWMKKINLKIHTSICCLLFHR